MPSFRYSVVCLFICIRFLFAYILSVFFSFFFCDIASIFQNLFRFTSEYLYIYKWFTRTFAYNETKDNKKSTKL